MKKWHLIIGTLLITLSLMACTHSNRQSRAIKNHGVKVVATIVEVVPRNGKYSYGIRYEVKGGEDIVQYALSAKKPVAGQEVELVYMRDEPVIFMLMSKIKYE